MYGYLGDLGFYGDAVSDLQQRVKAQVKRVAALRRAMWKKPLFSRARRLAEIEANKAVLDLRALRVQLTQAKASAGKAPASMHRQRAAEAAIHERVRARVDAGQDADAAEEQAKAEVLLPEARRAYPRGFFRPFARRGPRPARSIDPRIAQRSIDPVISQHSIDPRIFQTSVDPMIPQVSIDPSVPTVSLNASSGAFQFPPANIGPEDEDDYDLAGILDTVKGYAQKPLVMGAAAIAAILYGPKLLRAAKGMLKGKAHKSRKSRRRR